MSYHTTHMEIREVSPDDAEDVRNVALRSLEASYSLSPRSIETAVEEWYDDEEFAEKVADPDVVVLVTEHRGEVAAFSESVVVEATGNADLLWLHVDPHHRGEGIANELFARTRGALEERGVDSIRGLVLEDNTRGNDFYERNGFEKTGESQVEIAGKTYVENIYVERPGALDLVRTAEGDEVYVDTAESERGSNAPFQIVYADRDGERRYGYLCADCDSLVTSMDAMGRLQCSCGNTRKPTRWDAAYM